MNISIPLNIAWQIAAWEASAASFNFIEPELIVVGILSLEKVESGNPQDLKLSSLQWQHIKIEYSALCEAFHPFKLNVTSLRRTLRQAFGTGDSKQKDEVIHRSDACKKFFEEAEVDSDDEDSVQLEEEFSPDQLARLDQLEQDQV